MQSVLQPNLNFNPLVGAGSRVGLTVRQLV